MQYTLNVDLAGLKKYAADVQKRIPQAAASALNRAIDATSTASGREISAATKIPVREVRKRLLVRKASKTHLVAELEALPFSPSLSQSYFRPTQNKKGVAASAWEGRKTYHRAFKLPSGRVVTRTTNKRFPLKGLRGPSVPSTFKTKRVLSKMDAVARQMWRTRIEHEMARVLRR